MLKVIFKFGFFILKKFSIKTMGNKIYFTAALLLMFLSGNVIFSQQKQKDLKTTPQINSEIVQPGAKTVSSNGLDYKIISSTPSYLEIEYYPDFKEQQKIKYNGEEFSEVNLEKGVDNGIKSAGEPDVKSRYFPVIFPGQNNNTVKIIDYDVREVQGFNLAPIASYQYQDPHSWSFENIKTVYSKYSYMEIRNESIHNKYL